MPDVTEASDGYVPPPRTGPSPFEIVDPNVVTGQSRKHVGHNLG